MAINVWVVIELFQRSEIKLSIQGICVLKMTQYDEKTNNLRHIRENKSGDIDDDNDVTIV